MKSSPSQTWLDPRIAIRTSPLQGRGMFAAAPIQAGEQVVVFGGGYTDEEGAREAQRENKLVMQWDENISSVEGSGVAEGYFINHSCDPNTWMQDAFTLIARRDLKPGEELTTDYALWEAEETYVSKWECQCHSPVCRKRVTGTDWRAKGLQESYRGHFSPLLNKRIQNLP